MNIRNVLIIVGVVVLLSSCDFATKAYKETFDNTKSANERSDEKSSSFESKHESYTVNSTTVEVKTSSSTITDKNLLGNAQELAQAQKKLEEMFPKKVVSIYPPSIYFNLTGIRLQLVDKYSRIYRLVFL